MKIGCNLTSRYHWLRLALPVSVVVAFASWDAASAADWSPTKPVRMIVPFAPGGTTDLIGRIIATPLGKELGQQVIVDNRGGAGGVIGMAAVAQAQADGYTIGLPAIGAHASNETLNKSLPYDSEKAFQPLMFVGASPLVLLVNASNPANSLAELLGRGKDTGRPLSFASGGVGLAAHIAGELLKLRSGANMTHVPYKGGGPAMADLMGGQVDMLFVPIGTALSQIRGGRVRAMAVAGETRSSKLPEVPTMREAGFADFVMAEAFGFVAPAGIPVDVARALQSAIATVMKDNDVLVRLDEQGVEAAPAGAAALQTYIRAEVKKYREVIAAAGITTQ
jgi:tripartite-type tricarboxylate transporter receptor subunit TctC